MGRPENIEPTPAYPTEEEINARKFPLGVDFGKSITRIVTSADDPLLEDVLFAEDPNAL